MAQALLVLFLLGQPGTAVTISASPGPAQPGSVIVLTVVTPRPVESIHVRAFDRDLVPYPAGARRWRVLVGIDLETPLGNHTIAIDSPAGSASYTLHVSARRFRERRLTVDEAFVNPPSEVQARIDEEARLLQDLWRHPLAEKLWTGPFVQPVPDPANSAFGTRSILNGQPRSPHGGADFLSPTGRPVTAPNAGRVVFAGSLYYTGGTVIVDHGVGLFSLFAHLSEVIAHAGDDVRTGTLLGKVGATGRVTGPHLHWTVRLNGARVDPLALIAALSAER